MDIHGKILIGCVCLCLGVGIWTAKINAEQQSEIRALNAVVKTQRADIDSLRTEVTGLRKCVANQATISALQTSLLK
jgi:uncharacterized coiled-coil protein SlyX